MKSVTIFLTLITLSLVATAQNAVTLTGTVQSSMTGTGVPYASLHIEGTSVGTTSNIRGEYTLTFTDQHGTLVVSSLGYTAARIPLSTLSAGSGIITLQPAAVVLREVEVQAEKQTIIEAAIAAIPRNYDYDPFIMKVFARALSKRDDYPIQASEAAFEIYRGKIERSRKKSVSHLRINKGRLSRDSAAFRKIHQVNIGMTPTSLFRIDFVREAAMLHDEKERLKHTFTLLGITDYNGRPAYKVAFDQNDSLREAHYKGVMYIDTATLAFVRVERGWSDKGLPYLTETFENKAAAKILGLHKSKWNYRNMVFTYASNGSKWYPQTVTMEASFQLIREKEGLNTSLIMSDLFLITEIVSDGAMPFPADQVANRHRHIERQYDEYDAEFWQGYNYQLPDPGFKEIFEDIRQRNLTNRSAAAEPAPKSRKR